MRVPESAATSIVMIGSFNPSIFQPRWLATQQLIRPEEAETAKITTIQTEVADFSTEWFQLQVLQGRLMILTADPRQYGPLRDLAAAMFAILPHTPVTLVGINRSFHFKIPSFEAWHDIGHTLAPKEPWNAVMKAPGLRSMLMQGRREEAGKGLVHVRVEPSQKVSPGLFIEVNEEFKAPADGQSETAVGQSETVTSVIEGAQWVPDCLAQNWDANMQYAEYAAEQLVGLVKQ
jgi:hypothetical protein